MSTMGMLRRLARLEAADDGSILLFDEERPSLTAAWSFITGDSP